MFVINFLFGASWYLVVGSVILWSVSDGFSCCFCWWNVAILSRRERQTEGSVVDDDNDDEDRRESDLSGSCFLVVG